jgi:diguanylate cyclase (GGDEF)-like protein
VNKTKKNIILIVDDEKMNLQFLTGILQPAYTIYTAKDGPSAIEMTKQYLPDLILLDIVMPIMDGYEVLKILKKTEETCEIPVIIISGLNDREYEEKGLALGTADYISKPYSPGIIKLRVRNQIQIVNQISTIKRLSMMDQLTDIPNRRSFDTRLRVEWAKALRERSSIGILMIDIDYFKKYNDEYGHIQGDAALQAIAKTFSHILKRPADLAARWGGEEFAILLPSTDLNGAMDIAEKIRIAVENTEIPHNDGSISKATISVGVNAKVPTKVCKIESFVSNADTALYTAKKRGRNMVCLYEGKPA